MKRIVLTVTFLVLSAVYVLGAGAALADGVRGVAVKPLSPRPGEAITVKGELLGPNSTVEVRVIGNGVDLDLGEAEAADEGDFTAEFTLPSSLLPGTYELRATGAETATTQLRVVAGGGASQATPAVGTEAPERPVAETAGLVALFGALAGLGLFFARTARREPAAN